MIHLDVQNVLPSYTFSNGRNISKFAYRELDNYGNTPGDSDAYYLKINSLSFALGFESIGPLVSAL
jgi:hypothetical protein